MKTKTPAQKQQRAASVGNGINKKKVDEMKKAVAKKKC